MFISYHPLRLMFLLPIILTRVILRLVTSNSIEHIALYYRNLLKNQNKEQTTNKRSYDEYLKPVTAALVVMRDRVGQLPSELRPIYDKKLEYLSGWLSGLCPGKPHTNVSTRSSDGSNDDSNKNDSWPLPDLPPISNFSSRDVEKSLLSEVKFNFDNDDFLKEERNPATTASALPTNFNFKFGGKTQMTGHIIQPRFANKHQPTQDYYHLKRLQKQYLTNPLNKDYETLTGISKQLSAPNEVLTHTLIYHFKLQLKMLCCLNDQLISFDEYNGSRYKSWLETNDTYEKIKGELDDCLNKEKELSLSVGELDKEAGELKRGQGIRIQ
ncbi:unnamed protein product [Ambrosiozyma monospora]|uniref:Unnamed protein product n=1 Tax=Ambrosiozyma monospora TaxID=43982 RepID=A0ACB5TWQ8_AMBMO|nr:unnamed protein product [Ambrosiozyma monospora]